MRALLALAAVPLLLLATPARASDAVDGGDAIETVPGELVVDFKDGTPMSEIQADAQRWGIFLRAAGTEEGVDAIMETEGPLPSDLSALEKTIAADPHVEDVEPAFVWRALMTPNDPRFAEQWNLKMIHAPEAWDRATGKGVVVAIVDTGIANDHADLKGAKFAKGWNFVANSPNAYDDQGHGTHVAGTVAQVTNNGEGVAGVAFDATLMPVKVLGADGSGRTDVIADAIYWAADHGAQVINMSLGGGGRSETMANACAYARKKGVVVVAAAGNSGARCRGEGCVSFPAAYDGVIAVSAVGPDATLASYSSWGKQVAIAAPGGEKAKGDAQGVLQGVLGGGYDFYQGTSMASPHVAGVAALLISAGAKSPDEVQKALFAGATKVGDGTVSPKFGHGVLDADGALRALGAGGGLGGLDLGSMAARVAVSLLLVAALQASLRKKHLFPPAPGVAFFAGLTLAVAGLFFLRWGGLASLPLIGHVFRVLSEPLPEWERAVFGRATPIFYSAVVPFLLMLAGLPFAFARKANAGIAVGFAAFLLQVAWSGTPAMAWITNRPLGFLWLAANAGVAFLIARELSSMNLDPLLARSRG